MVSSSIPVPSTCQEKAYPSSLSLARTFKKRRYFFWGVILPTDNRTGRSEENADASDAFFNIASASKKLYNVYVFELSAGYIDVKEARALSATQKIAFIF